MKTYVRPSSCCRSCSRFSTCACTDLSSAETASSQTTNFGESASARDVDPLALAAAQLVRIVRRVVSVQAHLLEELRDPLPHLLPREAVHLHRKPHDLADGGARVQRRVWILKDHLHVAPEALAVASQLRHSARREHVRTFEEEPSVVCPDQPEDEARRRRLPTAGLADNAHSGGALRREREPVHRGDVALLQHAEPHRKALGDAAHFQERGLAGAGLVTGRGELSHSAGHVRAYPSLTSRESRIASASMLNEMDVTKMNRPGSAATQGLT